MSKRTPKAARMTPRVQPSLSAQPYIRTPLPELLQGYAEWWATPEDLASLSPSHITASAHMLMLRTLPEYTQAFKWIACAHVSVLFDSLSWLCLFEAQFQLTDGEG